jgi:hypothetical protein
MIDENRTRVQSTKLSESGFSGFCSKNQGSMKSNRFWDVLLKIVVAAITAAATALTTTSCMGSGPF